MVDRLNRFVIGCAATLIVSVVCVGCDTTNPTANDLGGVVVTVVDQGPALQTARTFALPDTIVEFPAGSTELDHSSDQEIISGIRRHFLALGWRDVTGTPISRPDVVVLVAAQERVETGIAYFDWFGGWGYLPYWNVGVDPSWGWGLPAGTIPYAYQAGTVLITMLDTRVQDTTSRTIPLLWAAVLDGVVTNTTNTVDRIVAGVDQAFVQSPYLRIP
ncbi:MAG TPA: DUF4136 domain-containing protein [Gemmatimonadaceae bacterium]|jgi:hypothetical protein|nr:DUF4136 domain-containing protein [Gemmatimonadaceae bacterium]